MLAPGTTVRVDVVVRTRKIGHFFPGGTVDAFDVWLELQGHGRRRPRDLLERQRGGRRQGPVEPGAHFYRAYQLDGEGNPIDKRNAWQARSVLYVRLIPPGAADMAHYLRAASRRMRKGRSHFTAKLNYRKFSRYYTQFAYAGAARARPGPDAADAQITTAWNTASIRSNIPANVSGEIKDRIPDLPIVDAGVRARPACSSGKPELEPDRSARKTASAGTIGASACCCRAI